MIQVKHESINIDEFLEYIVEKNKSLADIKNIRVDTKIESGATLEGNKIELSRVFYNIFDNAIKYTEKGHILVKINNSNDKPLVEIIDTGIGISNEYLPNLFKPFIQEEQGYTRKFEGNGLGLALVKKYCELNNIKSIKNGIILH